MTQAAWEPRLRVWSVGPGKTEEEKMRHAVTAIRAAIDGSTVLAPHDIEVLATGSFKNRTHIPSESDVDVAVIYKDVFLSDWHFADSRAPADTAVVEALRREAGVSSATYTYTHYKNDIETALVARFGRAAVHRGDKAFDIRENTYRVESDCVAAFEHRQWTRNASGRLVYVTGMEFVSDSGKEIRNYPNQQFENGEAKHVRTNRRFKKMVRIIKNLCNEMGDKKIAAAEAIPSFLIECLVYQVPDAYFGQSSFYEELRAVLAYIAVNTAFDDLCGKWAEVNDIKFLFHSAQPWTRAQANAFALAAFSYVDFS